MNNRKKFVRLITSVQLARKAKKTLSAVSQAIATGVLKPFGVLMGRGGH